MTIETAFALLVAMIVCAAAPGPGVFACIAKALTSGFKASIFVIFGIVLGNVVFLVFAFLGLSAIAQMLGEMFIFIAALLIAFALISVLAGYSYIASRSRHIFTSRRALRYLNRGAGGAMMGTGVIIATQSN